MAWPAVTGCSQAETFSQLSSISFAQLCTVFASNNSICMLEGCDGLLRWTSADTNPKYIPHTWKTVGDTPCNLCPEHDWGGGAQRAFLHQSSLHLLFLARSLFLWNATRWIDRGPERPYEIWISHILCKMQHLDSLPHVSQKLHLVLDGSISTGCAWC